MSTDLETLPNELLLQFFSYIDAVHLLQAFFRLNNRFTRLLSVHLQTRQLNLRRISKKSFDLLCDKCLPLVIYSIRSMYLSNEETPSLYGHLLCRGYSMDRFTYLQSLSLNHISDIGTLTSTISSCQSLRHFTHLFIGCRL